MPPWKAPMRPAIVTPQTAAGPANLGKPHITAELGAFIATCESDRIPVRCRTLVLAGLVDCCGVLVAGSTQAAPQLLEKTLSPARRDARLYFGDRLTGVAAAA